MTLAMHLGQRIRHAREQAQMSQAELARRIGISANALWAMEAGAIDPCALRIVAIAQELGISTDALVLGMPLPASRARQPTRPRPRKTAPVAWGGGRRPAEHDERFRHHEDIWRSLSPLLVRMDATSPRLEVTIARRGAQSARQREELR
jgi:transcriptional regulator with XRE-family HTH domain